MAIKLKDLLTRPFFLTEEGAETWMYKQVDDDCIDNYRFAYESDKAGCQAYEEAESQGCCGSFDRRIIVAGRLAKIGCNYGH